MHKCFFEIATEKKHNKKCFECEKKVAKINHCFEIYLYHAIKIRQIKNKWILNQVSK